MSIEKNSTDTVTGFTSDEELMYICAFRYAFGRRSYITEAVSSFLRLRARNLSTDVLELIMKELNIPPATYPGDECDKESWYKLFLAVYYELAARKNK